MSNKGMPNQLTTKADGLRLALPLRCSAVVQEDGKMIIKLKYGGQFEVDDLIQFIMNSSRDYIIQGQQTCAQANHTKPNSLIKAQTCQLQRISRRICRDDGKV